MTFELTLPLTIQLLRVSGGTNISISVSCIKFQYMLHIYCTLIDGMEIK